MRFFPYIHVTILKAGGVYVTEHLGQSSQITMNTVPRAMRLPIRMISPGYLLTILYQLTKSEATSPNGF